MRPRTSLPGACRPAAAPAAGRAAPSGSAARTGNEMPEVHTMRAAARGAPKPGPEH